MGPGSLKTLYDERIQTSSRKPPIHPKTAGQKKYIEAIRKHDVTFGIGPAEYGQDLFGHGDGRPGLKAGSVNRIMLTPTRCRSWGGQQLSSRGSLREARSLFATPSGCPP